MTSMEFALQQARAKKRAKSRRQSKRRHPDLSDREDILSNTLRKHSGR
jgi:hypothetical protein